MRLRRPDGLSPFPRFPKVQVASQFQVAYKNSYKFAFSFPTNETFVLYQARPRQPKSRPAPAMRPTTTR